MRISKKTDYALRALFTLVDHHGGAPIPIRELARRNDVPKRFLEQIMLGLKSQGWVDSVAGIRGGYRLAGILTAFSLRLTVSRLPATSAVLRNRCADSAGFFTTRVILSPI